MGKISIALYSTPEGVGYKAPQMERLLPLLGDDLCKFYGISYPQKATPALPVHIQKKMCLSKIPVIASWGIRKFCSFFNLPLYYGYLGAHIVFGYCIKRKLMKDEAQVVYLKPVPYLLVKIAKRAGKTVVIEAGEMHPYFTRDAILKEYSTFGINKRYIFTNKFSINSFAKSLSAADRIITISHTSHLTYTTRGIPEEKLKLISLSTPNIEIEPTIDINKKFVFLSTAHHSILKGTHRLLLAWKKANIKNMPLLIVGSIQDDLKEFLDKYGPFDNVHFVGPQNIQTFYQNYNAVGILLSFSEGAGRSVIEYLRYGYPVIVSPQATADVAKNEVNGFIVNPLDEDLIIEKLSYFSSDFSNITRMRDNVLKSVSDRTVDDSVKETADFLKELTR